MNTSEDHPRIGLLELLQNSPEAFFAYLREHSLPGEDGPQPNVEMLTRYVNHQSTSDEALLVTEMLAYVSWQEKLLEIARGEKPIIVHAGG
jgi:hypothetical protein